MKLKTREQFINEGLKYSQITKEKFLDLLYDNCHNYLPLLLDENITVSQIYRRSKNLGDFVFIDPKSSQEERIERYYPEAYHDLFISNTDSWLGWPRRNKSLCCSSQNRALILYML
jgi:hypothetical protein